MFHNKGEADDCIYKMLQACFGGILSGILCCLSQFVTTDFAIHLSCFSLWHHTPAWALPGKAMWLS